MRIQFTRLIVAAFALALPASAQGVRRVSLEDAIALADRSSQSVEIARAAVLRANGQQIVARSQMLPQLNGSLSYARTLRSQFAGLSGGGGGDTTSNPFKALCSPNIDSSATQAERQAALDQAKSCATGGGIDFSKAGFGALNQWAVGLQFSQNVFTGGRISGQRQASNAARNAADIELTAQRAQLVLDVTQAYYNAVLARRLQQIAEVSLQWNDDVLRQTTQARQVGSSSEFDLLRAQVARDNQVPIVLARRSDRAIALLRLKQLLEVPLDDSLELTTSVDEEPTPSVRGVAVTAQTVPDTNVDDRATVRQAAENVHAQEGLRRAARAEWFPSVAITSGYQRLFFPTSPFPQLNDFRENWTIGASLSTSLLSGGRTHGDQMIAEANLRDSRARLEQTRQLAALDSRIALNQLAQAEAAWRASQGTAEQAQRAYSIDQIRFREGISTQTDLTQSQLLVEQAMVNRAVAARDLAVARMRAALLKDLPLSAGGSAAAMGGGAQTTGAGSMAAPQQTPQTPSQNRPAGQTAGSSTGSPQQ
jgi:outer membrane protein TolC